MILSWHIFRQGIPTLASSPQECKEEGVPCDVIAASKDVRIAKYDGRKYVASALVTIEFYFLATILHGGSSRTRSIPVHSEDLAMIALPLLFASVKTTFVVRSTTGK